MPPSGGKGYEKKKPSKQSQIRKFLRLPETKDEKMKTIILHKN